MDIRSFLEKEYDLSLEVNLELPEGLRLGNYQMDLFTAAKAEEYMQENGITEEEFRSNSTYWYVFMTEENDDNVYTLFLNQNYFTREDIVKLAQSVKFNL